MVSNDCAFCFISRGEVPRALVAEHELALAFLPNAGWLAPGHTLVIPREHAASIFDVTSGALTAVMDLVRVVSESMRRGLGAGGVNILNASGPGSEQSVFHLHFHVVPRWEGDGFTTWPIGRSNRPSIQSVHEILAAHIGV